jgi:hypothetical protein
MRILGLVAALALGAGLAGCVVRAELPNDEPRSAFEAVRGQALPPPGPSAAPAVQSAPPEGVAAGGIDFGQWRGADPAAYSPSFEAQIAARLAGKSRAEIEADLEANGFACRDRGAALECRIEIMERQCAHDWYVALDPERAAPVAGFDLMCLGAL